MTDFDISSLLNFEPANYQCIKCFSLFKSKQTLHDLSVFEWNRDVFGSRIVQCPNCQVEYDFMQEHDYDYKDIIRVLRLNQCISTIDDLIEHSKTLAKIANKIKENNPNYPPIKGLFEALNQAKWFVHFTSYGITHLMIGALKLTAQRIPVRGIVSLSSNDAIALTELQGNEEESPMFQVKTFLGSNTYSELPHQKLIVIDGLLAFKGSVNLSQNAWIKILKNHEDLKIITNVDKVIENHNRLFSSLWKEVSDIGNTIGIEFTIPF